ncbi:MAG: preprotein translocase subunit SecE [Candidatus Cloacimonadota bacterium]|nr:MAG: preprotein translocase subunit SecE [Candidatus Cloacimonadota bacterium]
MLSTLEYEVNKMSRVIQFLKEVKIELLKVTWPKKDELIGSTSVVLIISVILSVFIGFADFIIRNIIFFILSR